MEIQYNRGIILKHQDQKLYLDPELSSTPIANTTLVTHAHSDHTAAVSGGAKTYLTETTMDLYKVTHRRSPKNYTYVEFNDPFEIGPFEVEYIKAGHLLGAAQIVVRQGNNSFLYTGDFCPEELLTVNAADVPNDIDMSVIDSTYGDSKIKFDTRANTRQRMFTWLISQLSMGKIPVINVGHLGGAQEIIKLLNHFANNLPVVVSDKVADVCEVYTKNGVLLNYYRIDHPEVSSFVHGKCVFIMSRAFKKLKELQRKIPEMEKRTIRAIVTGQTAKYGFSSFDYAAPLSTHAHFDELISTIKKLDPVHVLTHFGFADELAKHLVQKHSLSAQSLETCDLLDLSQIKANPPSLVGATRGYVPLDELF